VPTSLLAADPSVGGFRTVGPERTWERIRPMLPRFGITRVADVTGLDEVGIHVHVAYRPTGRTLAVTAGSATTVVQSKVSAVMESIESWHAENPRLPRVARCPARDLDLGYPVRSLNLRRDSPLTDRTVLDWVPAAGITSGAPTAVPFDTLYLDFARRQHWGAMFFEITSSGLAVGNTFAEASLHGLFEMLERHNVAPFASCPPSRRVYVDLDTVTLPSVRTALDALARAGCWVQVCDATGDLGVPCYFATIWSPELPVRFGGIGCHVDGQRALGRAIDEAALSRLTTITGARDDISWDVYRHIDPLSVPPPTADGPFVPVRTDPVEATTVDDLLRRATALATGCSGVEPIVVDLTRDDIGIPAVKVYTPGLAMVDGTALGRTPPEPGR